MVKLWRRLMVKLWRRLMSREVKELVHKARNLHLLWREVKELVHKAAIDRSRGSTRRVGRLALL